MFDIMLLGNCKLNQQWDTIPQLLEWLKSKNTGHTKRWWGCGPKETHPLLLGMQYGTATLEDSVAVASKTKTNHTPLIWSSSHTSLYLPQWVENLGPHKNLPTNVHSGFIHNC